MDKEELKRNINENIRFINDIDIGIIIKGVDNIHQLLIKIIKIENEVDENKNQISTKKNNLNTVNSDIFEINNKDNKDNNNNNKSKKVKFKIFNELQNDINYNICNQLLKLIIRIENFEIDNKIIKKKEIDELMIKILQILQGILLIHPNSRNIFKGKFNIKLLINLLNPKSDFKPNFIIIIETVLLLVSLFIRNCENLRNFEELNGIKLICELIKGDYENITQTGDENQLNNWQNIRIKSLEFLFFYLIPEFNNLEFKQDTIIGNDGILRRNMESKIKILKKYLNEEFVDGIVKEFLNDKPFGDSINYW